VGPDASRLIVSPEFTSEFMRFLSTAILALIALMPTRSWSAAPPEPSFPNMRWARLPALPDRHGFAGAFAGVSGGVLIFAGGTNFPERPPWAGGIKIWHDSICVLDDAHGPWRTGPKLPRPIAYGVSITTQNGLICVGGGDAERHFTDVFLLAWSGGKFQTTSLPPLPRPCAFMTGARVNDTLFIAGGIDRPDAATALNTFWSLDLSDQNAGWRELEPWPGPGRILAVAGTAGDSFYLFSGASLHAGPDGKPERTYLRDAYRYTSGQGWKRIADLPRAAVAAPSPTPANGSNLLVFGGDDGSLVGHQPSESHPGFSRTTLAYDVDTDSWRDVGVLPFSLVTCPAVSWRGHFVVCSGECRPGVRVSDVWAADVATAGRAMGVLDAIMGLSLLALLGFGVYSWWRGKRRITSPDWADTDIPDGSDRGWSFAWLLVGMLWVVAVLNYLDRQILSSVFPLLRADLHLSDLELGLLNTAFLWSYGLLSPFAGYLADRFGRRRIIVASLLIWSIVTWATGLARTFGELLGTRALMGLSEACYLPAALALIASVHPARSRSLATGIHQSGLYVGIVLGGVGGGWLGERFGWRAAFTFLGLAGVLYVIVLGLVLRDGPPGAEQPPATVKPRFVPAVKELLGLSGFGTMAFVFGSVAVANWSVYTWLPDYLNDRFQMSLTMAGFSATFYIQMASVVGILSGGWLADRWSSTSSRGRVLTQTVGLLVAAPALFLVGFTSTPGLLVGSLIVFGLGRGLYDCNIMPALCQIARPELRSTGYGLFNLVGCVTGGGVAAIAGAMKDQFGLGAVFEVAAILLIFSTLFLWRLTLRWI
jgi:N-acetylneuraminic acid mutarotase/predicted MFS family arabinose efflux permease